MERILLVDDDRFFREICADLLREEGYAVDKAACGQDALDALAEDAYRLVITDLVMPDMSGLDLLSRVKRHDPNIEVIIVTGNANVETAIYALKNGARDYLVKPFNHDEFKHTVALCIEQRRLLDENLELRGLVNLFQIGQTIANCLDLDRLYLLVLDLLAKQIGVSRGVGLFPGEGSQLEMKELVGLTNEAGTLLSKLLLAHYVTTDGIACSIERLENFVPPEIALLHPDLAGLKESLLLPIRSKTAFHGVVVICNDDGKPLPEEISFSNLNFILEQAAIAFENAVRFASARNLLYIDDLTGLFNYRYLDLSLDREIKRAERYGSMLSVIFIDIDLFKQVNDTYGHLLGSAVLKEFGALVKKSVREVDTVIRYGGDEYTVILVETDFAETAMVAERIRAGVEAHRFMEKEGYDIRLTACLGHASYPKDAKTKQELLDMADQAMYRGKRGGKNLVFAAAPKKPAAPHRT